MNWEGVSQRRWMVRGEKGEWSRGRMIRLLTSWLEHREAKGWEWGEEETTWGAASEGEKVIGRNGRGVEEWWKKVKTDWKWQKLRQVEAIGSMILWVWPWPSKAICNVNEKVGQRGERKELEVGGGDESDQTLILYLCSDRWRQSSACRPQGPQSITAPFHYDRSAKQPHR